jgi:hypothetical protein
MREVPESPPISPDAIGLQLIHLQEVISIVRSRQNASEHLSFADAEDAIGARPSVYVGFCVFSCFWRLKITCIARPEALANWRASTIKCRHLSTFTNPRFGGMSAANTHFPGTSVEDLISFVALLGT